MSQTAAKIILDLMMQKKDTNDETKLTRAIITETYGLACCWWIGGVIGWFYRCEVSGFGCLYGCEVFGFIAGRETWLEKIQDH